jgi:hypothetical protein
MNKLELKALQEAINLLDSFESYKFYELISSTKDVNLMKKYEQLSQEQHSKIDQAKGWLNAVLSEQKIKRI